jgi:multiple sugar transport system ATP-binding protein
VALVFQSYALYPRKTVFQNMAFPLEARSLSRAEIEQRVNEVARKLHIDGLLDRRPAQLSGGQQQRVALGRAMVRQPRVFLMDEPLTNLDFKLRVEMRAELKRLQQELNATFFYVTNDQIEAMSMADRIAVLNQGVLQQVDTPEQVYRHPANLFVAGFIGSPRINFINGTVDTGARLFVSGDGAWRIPLTPEQMIKVEREQAGREVVLGIRSEEIELLREAHNGSVPGMVYIVEPLGDKTIVDMQVGGEKIKVKVPPTYEVRSGEALHLQVEPNAVHLFDKASGQAII